MQVIESDAVVANCKITILLLGNSDDLNFSQTDVLRAAANGVGGERHSSDRLCRKGDLNPGAGIIQRPHWNTRTVTKTQGRGENLIVCIGPVKQDYLIHDIDLTPGQFQPGAGTLIKGRPLLGVVPRIPSGHAIDCLDGGLLGGGIFG